jgi:ATP-dependent Lhr-like helicase
MVRASANWGIAPLDTGASDIVDYCRKRWRPCPRLYRILCQDGPFRQVSSAIFADVLRAMGQADPALIEQAKDGLLLLGPMGETLVSHYSFYAVFQTPEEYRLISDGRELGTLPVDNMVAPGMMLIFSGRRWLVQEVDDRAKVILVSPRRPAPHRYLAVMQASFMTS